jgi:chemotaxis protein methyltransferase CheR
MSERPGGAAQGAARRAAPAAASNSASDAGSDAEFARLIEKISRERSFGCASYKEKCLRRRIAVRMRAKGVHTYGEYARILDSDAREYELLLDALTINVTKLFRNWEVFSALRAHVVPELWSRPDRLVRVWSAGCASGEETYSLAILFYDHAVGLGRAAELDRLSVIGTDIDRDSLAAAERGEFEEAAFADTPRELRRRYFSAEPPFAVSAAVRPFVRFERRDLLAQPAPAGGLHLISCRNVVIYFDRATQESLFDRFHEALLPGGYLVLGKVETLLGRARARFAAVDPRERIFRRL